MALDVELPFSELFCHLSPAAVSSRDDKCTASLLLWNEFSIMCGTRAARSSPVIYSLISSRNEICTEVVKLAWRVSSQCLQLFSKIGDCDTEP